MTKNTVKSCIIALVTAISATICGDMVTIYHNYQLNGKPISVWGQIECVSYACATNNADFKLSFVQSLAAKGTSVTNAYPLQSVLERVELLPIRHDLRQAGRLLPL